MRRMGTRQSCSTPCAGQGITEAGTGDRGDAPEYSLSLLALLTSPSALVALDKQNSCPEWEYCGSVHLYPCSILRAPEVCFAHSAQVCFAQPVQVYFAQIVQVCFAQPVQVCFAQPVQVCFAQPVQVCFAQIVQVCFAQIVQVCFAQPVQVCFAQPVQVCFAQIVQVCFAQIVQVCFAQPVHCVWKERALVSCSSSNSISSRSVSVKRQISSYNPKMGGTSPSQELSNSDKESQLMFYNRVLG
ncbi:PREDICTED: uncharacterized protein LOC106853190 isoform X1 [Sturnus vulgaris]|uniref:uncharacterized protein LOC106853190 isoform X1 n=1 Tax=Sturnus vulgaris TaxID=9172 RepID=UPI00071A83F7|nr:PREDICTED: uncharacterized protein LOC106853190 isoform X1 [Sturnus vulgaris]